jgi:hypothetical protein
LTSVKESTLLPEMSLYFTLCHFISRVLVPDFPFCWSLSQSSGKKMRIEVQGNVGVAPPHAPEIDINPVILGSSLLLICFSMSGFGFLAFAYVREGIAPNGWRATAGWTDESDSRTTVAGILRSGIA